ESTNWSDPKGSSFVGAVTWANGSTGLMGTVSTSNSLVGSNQDDLIDSVTVGLPNGNYVVDSPNWNDGLGAVAWGNGPSGICGAVSGSNSLVGSTAGDNVGADFSSDGSTFSVALTVLSNGNYVVDSPNWNSNTGAVTWGSGTTGITGTISAANSLVGSGAGDQVGADFDASTATGSGGVTPLANGNYVVASAYWNKNTGAVTWGSGTAGVSGTISAANSLIGAKPGDAVGGLVKTFVRGLA